MARAGSAASIEIPRNHGKSTLCVALALVLLCADDKAGAEVYSAAANRVQAAIVFELAHQIVEASRILARRAIIVPRITSPGC